MLAALHLKLWRLNRGLFERGGTHVAIRLIDRFGKRGDGPDRRDSEWKQACLWLCTWRQII